VSGSYGAYSTSIKSYVIVGDNIFGDNSTKSLSNKISFNNHKSVDDYRSSKIIINEIPLRNVSKNEVLISAGLTIVEGIVTLVGLGFAIAGLFGTGGAAAPVIGVAAKAVTKMRVCRLVFGGGAAILGSSFITTTITGASYNSTLSVLMTNKKAMTISEQTASKYNFSNNAFQ